MSNIVNICTADIIYSFVRKKYLSFNSRKLHVTVLLHLLLISFLMTLDLSQKIV
jgi:hypothetical protein